jgi:MFS family permease
MSTAYVPCTATVVRWFVRRRGLAVGLASAGGSLGTFVLPQVAHLLVSRLGWRAAYVVFGLAIAIALGLLAQLMRREPEALGLRPDGDPPGAAPEPAERAVPVGAEWTPGAAIRSRAFWMLFAVFGATWLPVFVPLVHLVPHARDLGIAAYWAATLVSATGIGAIAGRVLMGAVSDRVGRRPALALGLVLQALSFAGFVVARELPALYATALAFGFAYGAVSTMLPATVSDFFGRRHAGALVGMYFGLGAPIIALGPVAAGWIYDRTGSYALAWWLSAAANGLALALLAGARAPQRDEAARAGARGAGAPEHGEAARAEVAGAGAQGRAILPEVDHHRTPLDGDR